ncbi:phosphatase PAP2 family protein [bacterium]|nr:phosphatase PAP2 family protein [bacterium]RQV94368.1 MAG: phosphatase PAP2 family protein [bacterium]
MLINQTLSNRLFDFIMPYITNLDYWRIPLFLVWLALIIFGGRKGRTTALLVVIILTLSDQLSSAVIKPWINRLRPCFALENVRLLIAQSSSPSFPSSHAANNAAMAALFSIRYKRYTALFISIALLVSYSRIYVGVHYPSDVLGGILIGILCCTAILLPVGYFGRR